MEGGEIGLIVVCALVWLLVAVSAVAAYRYQQRASKFNSEARNLLQRFIAEHSDRREHASARLQSSRSLENLLVHEITDAEQTEPGVSGALSFTPSSFFFPIPHSSSAPYSPLFNTHPPFPA